jgi:hypothetical protein
MAWRGLQKGWWLGSLHPEETSEIINSKSSFPAHVPLLGPSSFLTILLALPQIIDKE